MYKTTNGNLGVVSNAQVGRQRVDWFKVRTALIVGGLVV